MTHRESSGVAARRRPLVGVWQAAASREFGAEPLPVAPVISVGHGNYGREAAQFCCRELPALLDAELQRHYSQAAVSCGLDWGVPPGAAPSDLRTHKRAARSPTVRRSMHLLPWVCA
jgi:hypothetical protein